jgi:hypothetical protein
MQGFRGKKQEKRGKKQEPRSKRGNVYHLASVARVSVLEPQLLI